MKKYIAILFSIVGMLLFSGAYAAEYNITIGDPDGVVAKFKKDDVIVTNKIPNEMGYVLKCTSTKATLDIQPIVVYEGKNKSGTEEYSSILMSPNEPVSLNINIPEAKKPTDVKYSFINFTVNHVDKEIESTFRCEKLPQN